MSYWTFRTRRGAFFIVPLKTGGVDLYWGEDRQLGWYTTPEQAADDAGGGHHETISARFDGESLGVPRDLGRWEFVRR